jgi:hypothetical protein
MTCTKTGALIYVEQYGEYAYGDAFEVVGDGADKPVAYFNIVMRSRSPINYAVKHYTVHDIEHWFGPHDLDTNIEGRSVLIAADFTNHGYDGVPIAP